MESMPPYEGDGGGSNPSVGTLADVTGIGIPRRLKPSGLWVRRPPSALSKGLKTIPASMQHARHSGNTVGDHKDASVWATNISPRVVVLIVYLQALPLLYFCPHGGIGRHACLKNKCFGVQVQILLWARR
jgi:hypothetical protein